jgi:hypothetical protein
MAKSKNLNFVGAIRDGENPKGQTSVTVNGLERQKDGGYKSDFTDIERPRDTPSVQIGNERKRIGG